RRAGGGRWLRPTGHRARPRGARLRRRARVRRRQPAGGRRRQPAGGRRQRRPRGRCGVSLAGTLYARYLLSRAKHPSLRGHVKMALRVSRLVPFYEYDEARILSTDGAPGPVVVRRREGVGRLARELSERAPRTLAASADLRGRVSDADFVSAYRV